MGVVSTSPAPSAATPSSNGMSLNSQGGPRPNPGKPLPNARSRWKKITGTAMFINKLGKIECRIAAKSYAAVAKNLAATAAVSKNQSKFIPSSTHVKNHLLLNRPHQQYSLYLSVQKHDYYTTNDDNLLYIYYNRFAFFI